MKKRTSIIFTILIGIVLLTVIIYSTGRPGYGDTHDVCHDSSGYLIETTVSEEIKTSVSTSIVFNITATGSNLFVQIIPDAKDNSRFVNDGGEILPTRGRINDTSIYDLDSNSNSILVTFNLTAPSETGYYIIFIIAGNDVSGEQINFDYLEITINVGGVKAPLFDWSNILDHLGLYLGLPALILLTLGTILVLINENKFVKIHGILAGVAWILTVVNLTMAIIKIPTESWFGGFPLIYHLPHIILGALGIVAGFFSMLFGIAAERKPAKITGYIALISWWGAFFLGYFLNSNLLML